jgi:hypothetical protein
MAKKLGILLLGGVVVAGALLLGTKKASASAAEPEPDDEQPPEVTPTSSPEEVFAAAMAPTMTDPAQVQQLGEWLVGSGQRPDLGAQVTQKATALRAEAILREALDPSNEASTAQLSQWAQDLQYLPTYLQAVRNRSLAEQGRAVDPARQSITLLSGTGDLVVDYDAFLPDAPADATPPVTVKPKKKKKTPASEPVTATPATTSLPTVEAAPITAEEMTEEADPNGTVTLARALLASEQQPDWRSESPAVAAWESKMGLGSSGKFGPDDAIQMAQEVAILPLIRFWKTGGATLKQQLFDYRRLLYLFADSYRIEGKPEHAAALVASAEREQGQGWPSDPQSKQAIPFDFPDTDEMQKIIQNLETITTRGPSNG